MAGLPQELFRKSALEQLESPEQLDVALRVTDRKGWLALGACFIVLGAVLAWSWLGRLPTRIVGTGILVTRGGLATVSARTAGQVLDVHVQVGARVERGQSLVRLAQPELELEAGAAAAALRAVEDEHARLSRFGDEEARLRTEAIRQQRAAALAQLSSARERQAALRGRLDAQQKLLRDGLITEALEQATRDAWNQAGAESQRAQATLAEADLAERQSQQRLRRESDERLQRIDEARRRLEAARSRVRGTTLVSSPATGRVLELRVAAGQFVAAGAPLLMIEGEQPQAGGLVALLYVAGADGKRLRPGMSAEISPSTVRREEFGALRGSLRSVAAFPATQEAMLAQLGNAELAASFLKTIEAPIQVEAEILVDARTPSGYRWTSRRGPPLAVQPGTLCRASITVREQAPLSFVLPRLQEALGL